MVDEETLMKILDSRERRAQKQSSLIEEYNNTLISFTLNIPGKIKDKASYRALHIEGMGIIEDCLKEKKIKILYIEEEEHSTGREGYLLVDKDSHELKQIAIDIEEGHPLGRIFDIDIFNSENEQISRSNLDSAGRRCLLCDKDARVCMRIQSHTYEDLIESIDKIWLEYINKK